MRTAKLFSAASLWLLIPLWASTLSAQQPAPSSGDLPAASGAAGGSAPAQSAVSDDDKPKGTLPPEPKRILGFIPNFRAVSAGAHPPPPSPREAFMIATQNSFDYSAFIFVGINSGLSEWDNAHPQLGRGMEGYGSYYWRGFVTRTDANYLVLFAMPSLFHQDERYYELGKGSFWKRVGYSASRVLVTPSYHRKNTFNASLLLGQGIAQAIALSYYPSLDRTPGKFAERYGIALGRGALTNALREFWPDISTLLHHRHP